MHVNDKGIAFASLTERDELGKKLYESLYKSQNETMPIGFPERKYTIDIFQDHSDNRFRRLHLAPWVR